MLPFSQPFGTTLVVAVVVLLLLFCCCVLFSGADQSLWVVVGGGAMGTFASPLANGGGCLWWIWSWVVIGGFGLVCGALG